MTKAEAKRIREQMAWAVAERIDRFLQEGFQRNQWTNGNTEIDLERAQLAIAAANKLIIKNRDRARVIKARLASGIDRAA